MSTRSDFVKNELQNIYSLLSLCYDNTVPFRMENDTRFIKTLDFIMEIKEKSNTLSNLIKGNYIFI